MNQVRLTVAVSFWADAPNDSREDRIHQWKLDAIGARVEVVALRVVYV
jgi:hypothetical protein